MGFQPGDQVRLLTDRARGIPHRYRVTDVDKVNGYVQVKTDKVDSPRRWVPPNYLVSEADYREQEDRAWRAIQVARRERRKQGRRLVRKSGL